MCWKSEGVAQKLDLEIAVRQKVIQQYARQRVPLREKGKCAVLFIAPQQQQQRTQNQVWT